MLSTITLIFWIISGLLAVGVCFYNADKTKGGKISSAFIMLGLGAIFMDFSAIMITFAPSNWDTVTVQFVHDIGFVFGFVFILTAANKFRKAMMGV